MILEITNKRRQILLKKLDKIVIGREAYDKIMYYVHKAKFEISGFGNVEVIDGIPTVTDIYLLKQENDPTETEMCPDAVSKAVYDHHMSNVSGEMKFWWHSHVNMDVFWSGTDTATMNSLTENGWFIHGVFNKKDKFKIAYTTNEPVSAFIDDLNLEIDEDLITCPKLVENALEIYDHEHQRETIDKEFKAQIKELEKEHNLVMDQMLENVDPLFKTWDGIISADCDKLFDELVIDKKPVYRYNKKHTGLVYSMSDYMSKDFNFDDNFNEVINETTGKSKLMTENYQHTSMTHSIGVGLSWREFNKMPLIRCPYGAEELSSHSWSIEDIIYMQCNLDVDDMEDLIDFECSFGDINKYMMIQKA